jgi:proteasome lid subunit RPN8/RPN11
MPEPKERGLSLPPPARREIEARAARDYPHEACGLLVGRRSGGRVEVVRVRPARNLAPRARERYELDPADHLAAEDEARALGLEVVGVWHSHPEHPARPSRTDLERAWPGWSYLIASVRGGETVELCAWRLDGDRFREQELCG